MPFVAGVVLVSVKPSVGVVPSNVFVIATLSPAFVGEITPPLERVQGPGPMKANCPAVVQALDPFWHWYKPALVEQNELAAPVVGGVVEQEETPEPEPDTVQVSVAVQRYNCVGVVLLITNTSPAVAEQ